MPEQKYHVHYALKTTIKVSFEEYINGLIEAGVSCFVINPAAGIFSNKEIIELSKLIGDRADIAIVNALDVLKICRINRLLLSNLDVDIEPIKAQYPHIKIGGIARSMSDCKNWELKGVDYLELTPIETKNNMKPILGSEGFKQIIPKEAVYGWMILSLNVPVMAAGNLTYKSLTEILKNATIQGVIVSDFFEPKDERITCIENIYKLFNEY